jgi:mRNA-degrading endonuclease toxin of MazEF toxin-antitoxin module
MVKIFMKQNEIWQTSLDPNVGVEIKNILG